MTEAKEDDHLQAPWCCLTCFHRFPIGDVKLRRGTGPDIVGNPHRLNCPNCRSVNIHPAGRAAEIEIDRVERGDYTP